MPISRPSAPRHRDRRTLVVAALGLAIAAPVPVLLATAPPPAANATVAQLADSDWTDQLALTQERRSAGDALPSR